MKIAYYCHFWAPYHFAGSEMMGQSILRYLRTRGHDTRVITTSEPTAPPEWEYEGTRCESPTRSRTACTILCQYAPDLILTHHQITPVAVSYARSLNTPVAQIIHNDMDVSKRYLEYGSDFVIYNTHWVEEKFSRLFDIPSAVLHPPVYAKDHEAQPGDHVTLINLNAHKGSGILYALADRMPDVKFLAVEGGHGHQIFETYPNVTHQPQTTDMKNDVWARTKILLTPSIYESYGMVSVEALASGIPVIAHPTPGLKEALGSAGTFVDRDNVDEYERVIRSLLDNDADYKALANRSRARSNELDPYKELEEVAQQLEELAHGLRNR